MSDPFYLGLEPGEVYDSREPFEWHTIELVIMASHGEAYPDVKIECKAADIEKSPCNQICMLKDLYDSVGWEIFRASAEIPLGKLSARIDWTDSEEPYVDLEP